MCKLGKNSGCNVRTTKLSQKKQNLLMVEYFINRLYGGPDFDALAGQIARLSKYAHKAEKLIPENAIKTGTSGLSWRFWRCGWMNKWQCNC
jgi:hypothetical protein